MTDNEQGALEGLETPDKTSLGFGGKTIPRRLHRGDELYLLMHCYISSEGEKETENGLTFSAGARTDILCELNAGEATKIAAAHGWEPEPVDDVDTGSEL